MSLKRDVPEFPGYGDLSFKAKPAPPKYLVKTIEVNGEVKTEIIPVTGRGKNLIRENSSSRARLILPSPTTESAPKSGPSSFSAGTDAMSMISPMRMKGKVDSKSEAKSSASHPLTSNGSFRSLSSNGSFTLTSNGSFSSQNRAPHLPGGALSRHGTALQLSAVNVVNNSSSIMRVGSLAPSYNKTEKFTFAQVGKPVGPDNPARQLNETWTAYWDDEASSIYYYNQITGEATWMPPEL